ncbi:MAG: DUF58 domain-containing protein [Desulfobacterales bacterium]|nr:MAG: DUF58 domain-containing protein [Desulfobacterales bacterium]
MRRTLYRIYRWMFSFTVWRRRKFTTAGLFTLVLLGASAAVGVDTTLAMVYQIFSFLFVLFVLSLLMSRRFQGNISIKRHLPRFATTQQRFVYHIDIKNQGTRPQSNLCLFEDTADPRPSFDEFIEIPEPSNMSKNPVDRFFGFLKWLWLIDNKKGARFDKIDIPLLRPQESQRVRVELLPIRRGRIRLSGLTLAGPDPFGMCRALHSYAIPESVLVLPKRYSLPPINLPGVRKHHSGGIVLALSVGDSEEFVALREYRPGDPLRRIHWKSWAKIGKPIVKEYQEEFFVRHVLLLDTFADHGFAEEFEEAVSLAASFACTVLTQESLLDLIFVGPEVYCFTSGRGLGQTDKILEVLASVVPCRDKSFESLFPSVLARAPYISGCICIFLHWDENRQKLVQMLRQFNLPLLVLVVIDKNEAKKLDPGIMSDLPENFQVLRSGHIEEDLQLL